MKQINIHSLNHKTILELEHVVTIRHHWVALQAQDSE